MQSNFLYQKKESRLRDPPPAASRICDKFLSTAVCSHGGFYVIRNDVSYDVKKQPRIYRSCSFFFLFLNQQRFSRHLLWLFHAHGGFYVIRNDVSYDVKKQPRIYRSCSFFFLFLNQQRFSRHLLWLFHAHQLNQRRNNVCQTSILTQTI